MNNMTTPTNDTPPITEINGKQVRFVNDKYTGGHFIFLTKNGKIFKNPLNLYDKLQLQPNDIVCDIGGFVGEYSLYCYKKGVQQIYVYEPTPDSFTLLTENCKKYLDKIKCFNMAVLGNNEPSINLYLSEGIGCTNSTKKIKKNYITVPCIRYEYALRNATIVKIDIEGGEYDFTSEQIIQPQLRGIIIEFHKVGTDWMEKANKIMSDIENSGYKCVFRPTFNHGWDLTGCWEKL